MRSARLLGFGVWTSFAAAVLFAVAGVRMIKLRSISANSVAEAFYQAFGWACLGFATLAVTAALVLLRLIPDSPDDEETPP